MKKTIKKFVVHEKIGPYLYGAILPIISISIQMYGYSIYGINVFQYFNLSNIYGNSFIGFALLTGFIAGICSKQIGNVFLKHKVDSDAIRNSINLSNNMTNVFYGSLITLGILFTYQIIMYQNFVTSSTIVNYETAFLYTAGMYTLVIVALSTFANFPILDFKFRFGFARICLKFSLLKETDILEKTEYMVKGIKSYNRFLGNSSDVEIKNTDKIISKLMFEKPEVRTLEIEKLEKSFDRGDLGPLEQIKRIISNSDPENFVIEKQRFSKFKRLIPTVGSLGVLMYFGIKLFIDYAWELMFP